MHRLHCQDGIPQNWRSGSFKMNFQVNNTCVFCAFEAPDNPTNLKIALERYRSHLSTQTWRYTCWILATFVYVLCTYPEVKVFMSGGTMTVSREPLVTENYNKAEIIMQANKTSSNDHSRYLRGSREICCWWCTTRGQKITTMPLGNLFSKMPGRMWIMHRFARTSY